LEVNSDKSRKEDFTQIKSAQISEKINQRKSARKEKEHFTQIGADKRTQKVNVKQIKSA